MANINLTDSSNIEVVQSGNWISLDLTTTGIVGDPTNLTTTDKSSLVSAINEVNGRTLGAWTYVDKKTGSTTMNIPSGAKELYMVAKAQDNDNLAFNFYIPILPTSTTRFNSGYYQGSSYQCRITVEITTTTVGLQYCQVNGSNVLSSSSLELYYRK